MSNIIKNNFLVISDYNWIPDNIEESWFSKYTDNYLIYDKFHRDNWKESSKLIKQKNVGQNHYDMFDYIVTHYDNLPEAVIFCRACLFFPKATLIDRASNSWKKWRPSPERCESSGNYNEVDFEKNCNNTKLTELHDFGVETICPISKIDTDNHGYLELNNNWYFGQGRSKYFYSLNQFFATLYKNPIYPEWVRFSPGGNYIIPKKNILKYSKKFYEYIREILSWDVITAEIWMVERATYTIFNCDWEVNDQFKI